jgi:hypothetical protein
LPPAGAPGLDGHVTFAWDDLDAWFEEDEQLIAHAIDPYHRVDVRRTSRHVVVSDGGVVLADTRRARALFESGLPTRWYIPREDIVVALEPSELRTVRGALAIDPRGVSPHGQPAARVRLSSHRLSSACATRDDAEDADLMFGDEHGPVWSQVARERGLSHEPSAVAFDLNSPGRLRGFIDGYGVELRTYLRKPSLEERRGIASNKSFIEARCTMLPPLATGLVVKPPHSVELQLFGFHNFDLGNRDDVQIGDARLDEALEIRGEPAHILPLFTPELRALLHSLLDGAYEVTLLDTGVALARNVSFSDAASLHHALGAVVQTTLLLDHARQVRDVASFRLSGDLGGGLALAAYPVWVARNHWATEVFVRFATPLGLGLFVRPTSWNDAAGALFAGQDLSVGDPAFDGPFVVQSWSPAALVAGVLDAEVRRDVLGLLARVGPVHLRDDGVALRANYVLSRAEDVWDMGRAVAPIAARLMANAERARRA